MPDVTAYTVIGRDVKLLDWCITNARQRAEIEHDWLVVGWNITQTCQDWCADHDVRCVSFDAPEVEKGDTASFLRNLYRSFNMGYELATTRYVARLGSDQFFSKGWLKWLMHAAESRDGAGVFHSWTVESTLAKRSRHDVRDFGSSPGEFDQQAFDIYADAIVSQYSSRFLMRGWETKLFYNHPYRGMQTRPDGCTWIQTRDLWLKHGPMEDGINREGVTGDVAYMDRLFDAGVQAFLVPPSVTYHLVRGESREVQAA